MTTTVRWIKATGMGVLSCLTLFVSTSLGQDDPPDAADLLAPARGATTPDRATYAAELRSLLDKGFQPEKYALPDAVAHFKAAAAAWPDDPRAHVASGLVCLKHDKPAGALSCFHRALAQNGAYTPAWQLLVRTHIVQQQYDTALEHLRRFAQKLGRVDDDPCRVECASWLGRLLAHLQTSDEHPQDVREAVGADHDELTGMLPGALLAAYGNGRQEMLDLLAHRQTHGAANSRPVRSGRTAQGGTPAELEAEKQRLEDLSQQLLEQGELAEERIEKELEALHEKYELLMNEYRAIPLLAAQAVKQRIDLHSFAASGALTPSPLLASLDFRLPRDPADLRPSPARAVDYINKLVLECDELLSSLKITYAVIPDRLSIVTQQAEKLVSLYQRQTVVQREQRAAIVARHDLLDKWQQKLASRPSLSRELDIARLPAAPVDTAANDRRTAPPLDGTDAGRTAVADRRAQRREELRKERDALQDEREQTQLAMTEAAEQLLKANNQAWESFQYLSSQHEECAANAKVMKATISQLEAERARRIDVANLTARSEAERARGLQNARVVRVRMEELSAQHERVLRHMAELERQAAGVMQQYCRGLVESFEKLRALREQSGQLAQSMKYVDRNLDAVATRASSSAAPSGRFADCFAVDLEAERERLVASLDP